MTFDECRDLRQGDKVQVWLDVVQCVPHGDSDNSKGWTNDGNYVCVQVKDSSLNPKDAWVAREAVTAVEKRAIEVGSTVYKARNPDKRLMTVAAIVGDECWLKANDSGDSYIVSISKSGYVVL